MLADTKDTPGIEERYEVAGNTSDLRVEADRMGSGDVMIAAGWSSSRVGMALLRLHSQFHASEKPARPTPDFVRGLVGTFQRRLETPVPGLLPEGKPKPLTAAQAVEYASAWYMHEMGLLLGKMKALPDVRQQVTVQALRWRVGDAEAKAAGIIRYWLSQTCTSCHGLCWQINPGSTTLSNRPCKACGGGGVAQVPHGQEGRRLANWMDSCVEDARGVLKRNLSAYRPARG
jgi:hypothetical protein